MRRNKEILPTQSLTIPDTSNHIDENQESWCLRDFDQDLISPQNLELDQYEPINKLVSLHFNEIELEYECEPHPQPYDPVPIFESMLTPISLTNLDSFPQQKLILVSIDLETKPPILDSHIPLMGRECEFHFFDLDSTIEPIPTLKPILDFFPS